MRTTVIGTLNRKLLVSVVAVLALLNLGFFFAMPYIVVWRARAAAERGDAAAVAEHVDFPALRENLKSSLASKANEYFKPQQGLAADLGAAFGGMLVDRMVDAMVTPESLAWLVLGYQRSPGRSSEPPPSTSEPTATMAYEGFSTFVVHFEHPAITQTFALVLEREGLSWKLTGVRLPP
jgi:hypothetical protein